MAEEWRGRAGRDPREGGRAAGRGEVGLDAAGGRAEADAARPHGSAGGRARCSAMGADARGPGVAHARRQPCRARSCRGSRGGGRAEASPPSCRVVMPRCAPLRPGAHAGRSRVEAGMRGAAASSPRPGAAPPGRAGPLTVARVRRGASAPCVAARWPASVESANGASSPPPFPSRSLSPRERVPEPKARGER